jgi:hypothetical protein
MANGEGGLGDFLNTKSMMTPGAAGGATLTITNTLGGVFHLPLGYVALAVSALFSALLWVLTQSTSLGQRVLFFLLNTLIIFCVAMGSNTAGQKISDARTQAAFSLTSAVYAQDTTPNEAEASAVVRDVETITKDPNLTAEQKLNEIGAQLKAAQPTDAAPEPNDTSQSFFRAWKF